MGNTQNIEVKTKEDLDNYNFFWETCLFNYYSIIDQIHETQYCYHKSLIEHIKKQIKEYKILCIGTLYEDITSDITEKAKKFMTHYDKLKNDWKISEIKQKNQIKHINNINNINNIFTKEKYSVCFLSLTKKTNNYESIFSYVQHFEEIDNLNNIYDVVFYKDYPKYSISVPNNNEIQKIFNKTNLNENAIKEFFKDSKKNLFQSVNSCKEKDWIFEHSNQKVSHGPIYKSCIIKTEKSIKPHIFSFEKTGKKGQIACDTAYLNYKPSMV